MNDKILEIKGLKVYFPIKGKLLPRTVSNIKAVDGINLSVRRGETLGLVGESGCGKSTTGRAILRMVEPEEGEIYFNGINILKYNKKELKMFRREMQLIFQDPFASLNPRMSIGNMLDEVLYVHKLGNSQARRKRTMELLEMVGLTPRYLSRFPHELSGGQRQRVVIARSLAVNPSFLVCDEPVSALDVSIQAQIIILMEELQQELDLTYLFIAHDLSVIKHISDRIAVMYLGKIVELADEEELFANPRHPYTRALLSAIPVCDPEAEREKILLGDVLPNPENPPSGCRFWTRCNQARARCKKVVPEYHQVADGHIVACHYWQNEQAV